MLTITRTPLSLVTTNTHYAMSDEPQRRTTRRSSARLSEKENTNTNGAVDEHAGKPAAASSSLLSSSQSNGTRSGKGSARGANGGGTAATTSARGGKRKQDYDEEDDGFVFTRAKSKRTKTAAAAKVPEPVAEEPLEEEQEQRGEVGRRRKQAASTQQEEPSEPAVAIPKRRGRKRSDEVQMVTDQEQNYGATVTAQRRRSARNSGDKGLIEPAPIDIKKRRSKVKAAETGHPAPTLLQPEPQPVHQEYSRGRLQQPRSTPVAQPAPTMIALPFADTPIIRRNQEMRRGKASEGGSSSSRRSSLGNRGRRASSLIDSGRSNALPHDEVDSAEFFKHIESGLPEPRRMRQLLTWCGSRAMGGKTAGHDRMGADVAGDGGEDTNVRMAAREIQQQILKDFGIRSDLSDWFGREEEPAEQTTQARKPNPRNLANEAKIKELESQLQRLQLERATWEGLLKPPKKAPTVQLTSSALPNIIHSLDASLLTSSNAPILEQLRALSVPPATSLQQSTREQLDKTTKDLEFSVDQLADNVHLIGQYRGVADRLATKVLDDAAMALEVRSRKERERSGTEEVGVRDVLRGLSRVEQR